LFKLFGSILVDSDGAEKSISKTGSMADNLAGKLGKAGKVAGDVGKGMSTYLTAPILGAGAAILGLATKAGNTADRLLDLSSITGMSTDAIQQYQHVASIAGVSTEAVTAAAEGLIKKLPTLTEGNSLASETFKEMGIDINDTSDNIMNNMLTALANIEDPIERNTKGSQLFGGAWKDLAPILDMGADGIDKVKEEAKSMGLVMSNESLNSANDFRIGMEKLKAQFSAAFMEIGTKLAPVLQDVLIPLVQDKVIPAIIKVSEKVSKWINWFANLDGRTQKLILTIVGIVAAIGPLLIIIGKVITITQSLILAAKSLGVVIAALTSPIGLTIAAIAALIAIGVLLYKNWDEIKYFFNLMTDWIAEKARAFASIFTEVWTGIWEGAKGTFTGIIEGIKNGFKAGLNWIIGKINTFVGRANSILQGLNSVPGVSIPSIPNIPLLAKGGTLRDNGMAIVGEQGPELISGMKGATVTPLSGKGGGITININNPHLFNDRDADKLGGMVVNRLRTLGVTT
jgi:hypothetical protein